MRLLMSGCLLLLLSACAATQPTIVHDLSRVAVTPVVEPAPAPPPPPVDPVQEDLSLRHNPRTFATALAQSHLEPVAEWMEGGRLVFPYRPEAIYRVFVKVGRVTDFQFGPGETLVNIVLGEGYDGCGQSEVGHEPDKQVVSQRRWIVECPTWSGSAPHVTTHLPVRSLQPNANTNLVIYSNQRVYQLDLVTHPRVHVPMVAWRYPVSQAATTTAQRRIPAQTLETGYVAKTFEGDAPAFIPEWIASSATQTYLKLPETVRGQEMPVLHVRLPDGTTPLVNYRVHDVLITADRVLHSGESFELRTGTEKTSGVVVISRTHTGTLVTCPGVALCEALASARP